MKKSRKILFISLLVICIIAINIGVYLQFFKATKKENKEEYQLKIEQLEDEFDAIFRNEFDSQNYSISNLKKIDINKELVYTSNKKEETKQGEYKINVNIPVININNAKTEEYNKKIRNIFENKLNNILNQKQSNTIYTVDYEAYLNSNILSLVIRATLKEDNNPQREIVQTFNYNISTNQEISLNELIKIKGLSQNYVADTIRIRIEKENKQSEELQNIVGQMIYKRDVNSDIYKIDNTNTYFLGKNNYLYILYPYGNSNYTSEIDIIVL